MSIHTDQATLDRWLADGRWVQFAPGEPQFSPLHGDTPSHVRPPADWQPEPCETCGGTGFHPHHRMEWHDVTCLDCNGSGVQRLAVTVPCDRCYDDPAKRARCSRCRRDAGALRIDGTGRITVAWAIIEWGPAIIVAKPSDSPDKPCVTILPRGIIGYWPRDGRPIGVPPMDLYVNAWTPDIGQWVRGGTIEAT